MNSILSLAVFLVLAAVASSQPNNQKFNLWLRYEDPLYNYYRSNAYVQGRNQKVPIRVPGLIRIQGRSASKVTLQSVLQQSVPVSNSTVQSVPVSNVPSSDDSVVQSSLATCYFSGASIFCTKTMQLNDTVECAVAKLFEDSLLEQLPIYALSSRQDVVGANGQTVSKFYLYPRFESDSLYGALLAHRYGSSMVSRPVVSLHSIDSIEDNGLTVINNTCWSQLVDYLGSVVPDTVTLHDSNDERSVVAALVFL